MTDVVNLATDIVFGATLLAAVVVLWLAYRDLVDRLLAVQSTRIVELQLEIDKLKRKDGPPEDKHDQPPRPPLAAPRVIEKQAALQQ